MTFLGSDGPRGPTEFLPSAPVAPAFDKSALLSQDLFSQEQVGSHAFCVILGMPFAEHRASLVSLNRF